ncbi:MAG: MFS transporter [Treponema sp.]|nr:MFS transporter [Treponema sp.]
MGAKISKDIKLLISLFLPFFLIHGVQQIYLTYAILLYQGYGFSYEMTGWIIGIYSLAAMLTRPLGGWLLENFGIRKILVWSGVVSFVGCVFFFANESTTTILIGRALSGTVFGIYFINPAILILIGRALSGAAFGIYSMGLFSHQALCVSQKRRAAMFSLLVVGSVLPMGIVAPLGEWLLHNSQTMIYLAIGPALSLLCVFFGAKVNVTTKQETVTDSAAASTTEKNWGTYSKLFSSRPFLFLILTGTVIALIDALIITLSLLTADKGLMISFFFTSVAITALIVRLPGASILNALPRTPLLAPTGILMALGMILVSVFPSNGTLIVGGILFGIGLGAGWPMYQALISDLLEPILRPKGTATALLLYDIGYLATPLIVGYFLPVFGTSATFAMIALAAGGILVLLEIFFWLPFFRKMR